MGHLPARHLGYADSRRGVQVINRCDTAGRRSSDALHCRPTTPKLQKLREDGVLSDSKVLTHRGIDVHAFLAHLEEDEVMPGTSVLLAKCRKGSLIGCLKQHSPYL